MFSSEKRGFGTQALRVRKAAGVRQRHGLQTHTDVASNSVSPLATPGRSMNLCLRAPSPWNGEPWEPTWLSWAVNVVARSVTRSRLTLRVGFLLPSEGGHCGEWPSEPPLLCEPGHGRLGHPGTRLTWPERGLWRCRERLLGVVVEPAEGPGWYSRVLNFSRGPGSTFRG